MRKTVEMFVQRLHEVSSSGGSVATDPVVLSHYQNLSALQPLLLKQIDDVQQKKGEPRTMYIVYCWCSKSTVHVHVMLQMNGLSKHERVCLLISHNFGLEGPIPTIQAFFHSLK